jgi:hypothetical protein
MSQEACSTQVCISLGGNIALEMQLLGSHNPVTSRTEGNGVLTLQFVGHGTNLCNNRFRPCECLNGYALLIQRATLFEMHRFPDIKSLSATHKRLRIVRKGVKDAFISEHQGSTISTQQDDMNACCIRYCALTRLPRATPQHVLSAYSIRRRRIKTFKRSRSHASHSAATRIEKKRIRLKISI